MQKTYDKFVRDRIKPGADIMLTITPEKTNLLHMAVGVAGEAGELLDQVKKYVIYNKDLDLDNVIEELGDLEFYISGIRSQLKIARKEVLNQNVKKLSIRYESKYSDAQAIKRKDKKGSKR